MEIEDDYNQKVTTEDFAKGLKGFHKAYEDCVIILRSVADHVGNMIPKMQDLKSEVYRRSLRNRNESKASATSQNQGKKSAATGDNGNSDSKAGAKGDTAQPSASGKRNMSGLVQNRQPQGTAQKPQHQMQVLLQYNLDRTDAGMKKVEYMIETLDELRFDSEINVPQITEQLVKLDESSKRERSLLTKKRPSGKPANEGHEMKLREKSARTREENNEDDAEVILSYSAAAVEGKKEFKFQLTKHDLKTLDDGQYINDAIILFFLKFIQLELVPEEIRKRIYIFDTYFIVKFREKCTNEFTKEKCTRAYQDMKKWTKNVDLLSKDFLVFPIHEMEHWSLIVACYPNKWFENDAAGDKKMQTEEDWKRPCIIGFDSLEPLGRAYPEMIQIYLENEYMSRRPEQSQGKGNHTITKIPPFIQMMVPKQNNLFDCGIYLLQYAELFLLDPEKILKDLDDLDRLDWFPKRLINEKREELKTLFIQMGKDNKEKAIRAYEKNRDSTVAIPRSDQNEYDAISMGEFNRYKGEYLTAKNMQDMSLTSRDLENLKLQFYLSCYPSIN